MTTIRFASLTVFVLSLMTPVPAAAQVFGTFSWQMQPYCNVVALTLVNTPAGFTLQGTDAQCGAADKAGAFGIASFNTAGNVTLNFTIVTAPAGKPVHVSAIVSPATGSGTWTDSAGNSGTFALSGAVPGLPPRPLPPSGLAIATVTGRELAPETIRGINVENGSLTVADIGDAPRATSVEGTQNSTLVVGNNTNVRQITLTVPAAGRVIVTVSARVAALSTGNDVADCSLTRGAVVEPGFRTTAGETAALPPSVFFPLSLTRGFEVTSGPFTARLVCQSSVGLINVQDAAMTAMFFPS